jgi:hypothetical protein
MDNRTITINPAATIRPATPTDVGQVSRTLADTFAHDPVFSWCIPDASRDRRSCRACSGCSPRRCCPSGRTSLPRAAGARRGGFPPVSLRSPTTRSTTLGSRVRPRRRGHGEHWGDHATGRRGTGSGRPSRSRSCGACSPRLAGWRSRATSCPTSVPSTSSSAACSGRAPPRPCGWTPKPGRSASGCALVRRRCRDHSSPPITRRGTDELVRRLVLASTSCGLGGVPGTPLALGLLATPLRYYSPDSWRRQLAGCTGRGCTASPHRRSSSPAVTAASVGGRDLTCRTRR